MSERVLICIEHDRRQLGHAAQQWDYGVRVLMSNLSDDRRVQSSRSCDKGHECHVRNLHRGTLRQRGTGDLGVVGDARARSPQRLVRVDESRQIEKARVVNASSHRC